MNSRHGTTLALFVLTLALTPTAAAQAVLDGSFEGQTTGPGLGPPWIVDPGTDVAVLDDTNPQAFLPTDGGKYLRIDPGTTGPAVGGHGPHPSGLVGKISQPFVIPDYATIALTLDWEWASLESLYGGPNNDFFSVDLLDPSSSPPALIANIIYIDSGAGMPAPYTNVPGGLSGLTYVAADLAWPSNGVPAPAGFKRAWTDLTSLVAPGQPVVLEITVGNGGDTGAPSFALIDNVSLLVAQRNGPGGGLRILGSTHLDGILGAPASDHGAQDHPEAPFEILTRPGQLLGIRASGQAGHPWALFAGDLARTGIHFPPVGTVNLQGNLTVVIDGIAPGGGDDLLGTIAPHPFNAGLSLFAATVHPATPPGSAIAYQGVMIDPFSPAGLSVTAATEVRIWGPGAVPRHPVGDTLVTPGNTGGTDHSEGANGDDGATTIPFANVGFGSGQWMYYPGSFWNEVWVGSNGNLTFGSPSPDCCGSQTAMLTGPPRIAPLWNDFWPDGLGSTVSFSASPDILTISWNDVPVFESAWIQANNFAVRLYADGQFTFYYGSTTGEAGMAGISPGNLPSPAPGSLVNDDWSDLVFSHGGFGTISPGQARFETFFISYPSMQLLDKFDLFTCGHGTGRVHFAPTGGGGYKFFTGTR